MNSMHLPIGTLLQAGKYKIVRFIGSGGFGCTYEAEHVMLEKRVAIKEFFVRDFCNRDEATAHVTVGTVSKKGLVEKMRGKFIDEARALSHMQHPHIVQVSDVFEENGTAYYVMDYIDGLSLLETVKRNGPLSESKALKYIRQAAEALKYVHAHNRLHLDVKPSNMMINERDDAVLIDFGASKQYDEVDGENTSTLMGKTPGYAPLEQIGNDVVKFMPATDIYALGATLYKLLTGITPISANLLASGEELAPLPNGISKNVKDAISAAMQINKLKRPQRVDEFLAILGSTAAAATEESTVLDSLKPNEAIIQPKLESEPKPKSMSLPKVKRKKISVTLCFVIVAITIAVISGLVWKKTYSVKDLNDNLSTEQQTQISEPTGIINQHSYVDLGLSVKWATCNIGASSPSDYGNYYAWGETMTKSEYTEDNSVTYKKDMGDIAGNSRYDAARANWGGTWRLPTMDEIGELINECKWKWTTVGVHNGYKIIGRNGNSIFLPGAGTLETTLEDEGAGLYWSSEPDMSDEALGLGFGGTRIDKIRSSRALGFSIRPVSE